MTISIYQQTNKQTKQTMTTNKNTLNIFWKKEEDDFIIHVNFT